ncbi:MAG: alpha/beta hydrolase [Anaerolineae bacterium]
MPEITSGYATVNGAQMYYEVAGEGMPVVFVHAGVADRRMWDDQFPVFAERYRAIRFDMRGFGDTEPVAAEYANRDDLYALLRFLGVERATLIGCSMGGGTCMDFALEHPDMTAALVMVGSGPAGLDLDVPMPPKFAEIEAAEKNGEWEKFLELETQVWFDGEGRAPGEVNQAARAKMADMNRNALVLSSHAQGQHRPMQPTAAERLSELRLPLLVVYGDRDVPYIQAAAKYMGEHIAGAQVVLMPDTAHLPNMERPDEFNQIVLNFFRNIETQSFGDKT